MMPIFFHLKSHLWITYVFFFNGFLIHYLLSRYSDQYARLTKPFEAQILAAFFISISINGLMLLGLDLLNQQFSILRFLLPIFSASLLLSCILRARSGGFLNNYPIEFGYSRLALYLLVFITLFYNGGLIEQISDAWWHMSLANKIGLASSFSPEQGHLTGSYARYYPPVWHGNLALVNTLSGISVPVFWNSFTAWGAMLKTMAFFLFALSLGGGKGGGKNIALLSALLFVLLPGVGDSYLRVSAWPSHIAYTAWFSLFYVSFFLLDSVGKEANNVKEFAKEIVTQKAVIICAITLLLVIVFAHQVEVLLFSLAFLFYFLGLSIYQITTGVSLEAAPWAMNLLGRILLFGALLATLWFGFEHFKLISSSADLIVAYALPVLALFIGILFQFRSALINRPLMVNGLLLVMIVPLLLSIDLRHLLSLFSPEMAYPKATYLELPVVATGWFGSKLNIPGWHLQLRSGLLYSGVLAIPLGLILAFSKPSRMTVFLASTSCFALLFCLSPYLYHWLREVLNYHSPWRISIMIFHPVILAASIVWCWQVLTERRKP